LLEVRNARLYIQHIEHSVEMVGLVHASAAPGRSKTPFDVLVRVRSLFEALGCSRQATIATLTTMEAF